MLHKKGQKEKLDRFVIPTFKVHDLQASRNMEMTREHISFISDPRGMLKLKTEAYDSIITLL